jgi:hypothetical protein
MYALNYDIQFNNNGKKFKLLLLASVNIKKSVENLVDTATIVLPESVLNTVLNIESKINRGTTVTIKLGYDSNLKTEFVGYVTDVTNNSNALVINCEDALFVFRKSVQDKIFKPAPVKLIVQYLVDQVDKSFKVVCDFDFTYEKFTIYKATAFDVLLKLVEELKVNIYFNTELKELHVHAPYFEKGGQVKYRMQKNVESSSLEYKRSEDKKLEINIECTGKDGKKLIAKAGVEGGDKITRTVSATSQGDLDKIVANEFLVRSGNRYEGSFTGWLIPYCEPTYSIDFADDDYKDEKGENPKAGLYYCTSVETNFSDAGGSRTIQLGIRL